MARGLIDYFPNALAEVAHVSFVGNQQHNPGQELHWSRGKSDDHADCVIRHIIERGSIDDDGIRHSAKAAWRALAMLQIELEQAEPAKQGPVAVNCGPTFCDSRVHAIYNGLKANNCPADVAELITKGTSVCEGPADAARPIVYVAGPMRGYEHFNFPAFDKARDAMLDKSFHVISPADIDRACSGNDADDPTKIDVTDQTRFVFRDFYAIYFLAKFNHTGSNGIVLLDNWFKSVGATAEFNLAKWLGLKFYASDGNYYFDGDGTCPKAYVPPPTSFGAIENGTTPKKPAGESYEGNWDYLGAIRGVNYYIRVRDGQVDKVGYGGDYLEPNTMPLPDFALRVQNGKLTRVSSDEMQEYSSRA